MEDLDHPGLFRWYNFCTNFKEGGHRHRSRSVVTEGATPMLKFFRCRAMTAPLRAITHATKNFKLSASS